jgi:hypothetical protein
MQSIKDALVNHFTSWENFLSFDVSSYSFDSNEERVKLTFTFDEMKTFHLEIQRGLHSLLTFETMEIIEHGIVNVAHFGEVISSRVFNEHFPPAWNSMLKAKFVRNVIRIALPSKPIQFDDEPVVVNYEAIAIARMKEMAINGYQRISFPVGEDEDGDQIIQEKTITVDEMRTYLGPIPIRFSPEEETRVRALPPYEIGSQVHKPYNLDVLSLEDIQEIFIKYSIKFSDMMTIEEAKANMDFHLPNYLNVEENLIINGMYHIRIPMKFESYGDTVVYPEQLIEYINPKIVPHTEESITKVRRSKQLEEYEKPETYMQKLISEIHSSYEPLDLREKLKSYYIDVPDGLNEAELIKLFNKKLPNYLWKGIPNYGKFDRREVSRSVFKFSVFDGRVGTRVNDYAHVMISHLARVRTWLVPWYALSNSFLFYRYREISHTPESTLEAQLRPSEKNYWKRLKNKNAGRLASSMDRNQRSPRYDEWLRDFESEDAEYNQVIKAFKKQPISYLTNEERGYDPSGNLLFTEMEKEFFFNGVARVDPRWDTYYEKRRSTTEEYELYVDVRHLPRITSAYRIIPVQTETSVIDEAMTGEIVKKLSYDGRLF